MLIKSNSYNVNNILLSSIVFQIKINKKATLIKNYKDNNFQSIKPLIHLKFINFTNCLIFNQIIYFHILLIKTKISIYIWW